MVRLQCSRALTRGYPGGVERDTDDDIPYKARYKLSMREIPELARNAFLEKPTTW